MECRFCKGQVSETDKFCAACGREQNPTSRLSEFELGRIAALDTVKGDILKWLGSGAFLITVILGVLATFSINEAINNRVQTKVAEAVKSHDDAILQADRNVAKAIGKLDGKEEELNRLIKGLASSAEKLKSDLGSLEQRRKTLEEDINSVSEKKAKLVKILEGTNFPFVFKMLEVNLYNIKDLRARTLVAIPYDKKKTIQADDNLLSTFNLGINLQRKIQGGSKYKNVVQFRQSHNPPIFIIGKGNADKTESDPKRLVFISRNHLMYPPYEDNLINKHVNSLNGIGKIELASMSFAYGSAEDKSTADKEVTTLVKFLNLVETIEVEIFLNGVSVWKIPIKPAFAIQKDKHGEEDIIYVVSQHDIPDRFADSKAALEATLKEDNVKEEKLAEAPGK